MKNTIQRGKARWQWEDPPPYLTREFFLDRWTKELAGIQEGPLVLQRVNQGPSTGSLWVPIGANQGTDTAPIAGPEHTARMLLEAAHDAERSTFVWIGATLRAIDEQSGARWDRITSRMLSWMSTVLAGSVPALWEWPRSTTHTLPTTPDLSKLRMPRWPGDLVKVAVELATGVVKRFALVESTDATGVEAQARTAPTRVEPASINLGPLEGTSGKPQGTMGALTTRPAIRIHRPQL